MLAPAISPSASSSVSERAVTFVLLIAALWFSLGIGVVVLVNVVKGQHARRGDLMATVFAAHPVEEPVRSVGRSDRS